MLHLFLSRCPSLLRAKEGSCHVHYVITPAPLNSHPYQQPIDQLSTEDKTVFHTKLPFHKTWFNYISKYSLKTQVKIDTVTKFLVRSLQTLMYSQNVCL
jgi:hypothetical protein